MYLSGSADELSLVHDLAATSDMCQNSFIANSGAASTVSYESHEACASSASNPSVVISGRLNASIPADKSLFK